MKTKEKNALASLKQTELVKEAESIEKKLRQIRLSRFTKPSKNTREAGQLRLRLAVVRTFMHKKETHEEK